MIKPGMCVQAKVDFLRGVHQPGDDYKIALYTHEAELNPVETKTYTPKGEVKSKGYVPGGMSLQGYTCTLDGEVGVLGWTYDPVWKNVTLRVDGALIYNASKENKAILIVAFDSPVISTNGNFRVSMPEVTATTAPIWIA